MSSGTSRGCARISTKGLPLWWYEHFQESFMHLFVKGYIVWMRSHPTKSLPDTLEQIKTHIQRKRNDTYLTWIIHGRKTISWNTSMQWLAEKNTGHAEQIREMFMPRKAFDDELRRDRLSRREAVVHSRHPPPWLMPQEAHCQMHRGITFHPSIYGKSTVFTVLMLRIF